MVIVSKQLIVPLIGKQLSDYTEGDIVQIPENGVPVEFYVAKHDYESGLNGAGRTLVVRKDVFSEIAWNSNRPSYNAWGDCTLLSWLNNDYKQLLDSNVQELIGETAYYYTPGNGNYNVTSRSDSIFQLSATELGAVPSYANTEGSAVPIADTIKTAYYGGSPTSQWTRSPYKLDTISTVYIYPDGYATYDYCSSPAGSRPVFTLPSTTKFNPNTNIIIG